MGLIVSPIGRGAALRALHDAERPGAATGARSFREEARERYFAFAAPSETLPRVASQYAWAPPFMK